MIRNRRTPPELRHQAAVRQRANCVSVQLTQIRNTVRTRDVCAFCNHGASITNLPHSQRAYQSVIVASSTFRPFLLRAAVFALWQI